MEHKSRIKFFSKLDFILILITSVIVILLYKQILNGYFQQDEWYGFGYIISNRHLGVWEILKLYFSPNIGHYNPLANIIQHYLYILWGTNYNNYAFLSMFLHVLTVIGVFILAKIIFTGNSLKAFFCSLVFGLFASSYQGTAWVVVSIATQASSLLGIISSIFFINFLKRGRSSSLIVSLLVLITSLLFKEITIGIFPLYVVLYFISRKTIKNALNKSLFIILLFGACYLFFRVSMLYFPNTARSSLVTQTQSPGNILYNFSTMPAKSIFQVYVPSNYTKQASLILARVFPEEITGIPGSPEFEKFSVEKLMEISNILAGLAMIAIGFVLIYKAKGSEYKFITFFGLGWVILNSLIYSFAPESSRPIFAIDSRNLYFVAVGAAILLANLLTLNFQKKGAFIGIFIALIYLGFNALSLNTTLDSFTRVGAVRKTILDNIIRLYPTLPPRAVIFTKSDSTYYGLPAGESILPFQSGLGQALLIVYSQQDELPHEFYPGDYLWDIKSQGYQEHDLRGFGYFREESRLKDTIKKYRLPVSGVFAFTWEGKTNELIDITKQVRNEIIK
ncbi:hypothetical protein HY045_02625 [Candidatus Woesebacteria bacterium]|nr:hypothetical protein [Candidatus Woesebacteria bacterium]